MFGKFLSATCVALAAAYLPTARAATVKNVKSGDFNVTDPSVWGQTTMSASDDYEARAVSGGSNSSWIEIGNDRKSLTFPGKSLRLFCRTMYYGTSSAELTFTFPRDGLYLGNGTTLRHRETGAGHSVVHFTGTKMTVEDGRTVKVGCVKSPPNTTVLSIDMPIYGNANTVIDLYHDTAQYTGATRFRPTADQSHFLGKITISGDVSNRVVALSSPHLTIPVSGSGTGGIEQGDPAAVCESDVNLTGIGKGCVFMTTNGTFTVKKLTMAGGAFVYLPYGTGTGMRNPGVVVLPGDGTFATTEPIALRVNRQALMFSGQTLGTLENVVPLVRYEGSLAFPLHNFYLDVVNDVEASMGTLPGEFSLGMTEVDGAKVIYVQVPALPIFKVNTDADDAKYTADGHRGSALSDGMGQWKWSDGLDQHPNANYIVGKYNGTNMAIIVSDDLASSVFRGIQLAIAEGCKLSLLGKNNCTSFEAADLCFAGNSQLMAYNAMNNPAMNWLLLGGPVRFIKNSSNSYVNINPVGNVDMTFTEGIVGTACLLIRNSETNKTPRISKVVIAKPSFDFSGCIEVRPASNALDQRPGKPQTLTTLEVPYANCLGGLMPAFNFEALAIYGNQTLSVTETTAFEDPTRGIAFRSIDQGVPANLKVADGKTVTIRQPLTLYGEVCKLGGGTLALDNVVSTAAGVTNAVRFGFSGVGQGSYTPQENTNRFTVAEGTLMPLSTNVLDGCEITFKAGTRLKLKADTEDAAMRRYGLYNTKWPERPIVLEDTETINVDFEAAPGYELPPNNERVAICTVPMDYNGLSVESFRIGPVGERRGVVVVETDMTAMTRTFYADFSDSGMAIVVR